LLDPLSGLFSQGDDSFSGAFAHQSYRGMGQVH
jgi:hypothetical protein